MKVTITELEQKLKKILELQKREDVSIALFKELSSKAMKYKEIIFFLKEDDVDNYVKTEELELEEEALRKHLNDNG